MKRHPGWLILGSLALALLSSSWAVAQAPSCMIYKGHVDLSQLPATCVSPFTVDFAIYAAATGGTPVWSESPGITPDANGDFTVLLGSTNALTSAVFNGAVRYLSLKVCGNVEILPRQILASAPYAISAGTAPTAGAVPAGLTPIAYGAVNANGTRARAGSGNWTVHRSTEGQPSYQCVYEIAIEGVTFDAWRHTALFTGLKRPAVFVAGAANGQLTVTVTGENVRAVGRAFHFMVFALPGMSGSVPMPHPGEGLPPD